MSEPSNSRNPFDKVVPRFERCKTLVRPATRSRIGSLTVGDVRYILTQLRGCKDLTPQKTLWTGESAGSFSLNYLLQSSSMLVGGERRAKQQQMKDTVK